MTFEIAKVKEAEPVRSRKAYYFWGLAPTVEVDLGAVCPAGVASIQEETTFTDGLFSFFTLGIYSPRTSLYYCRADGAPA